MNTLIAIAAIGLGIGEPSPPAGSRPLGDPEPRQAAPPIVIRFHEDSATKADVAQAVESIRRTLEFAGASSPGSNHEASPPPGPQPGPVATPSAPAPAEIDHWTPYARNPAYEVFGHVHADGWFRYTHVRLRGK